MTSLKDSFGSRSTLQAGGSNVHLARLDALERRGWSISRLPYALRILLENLLRREDGEVVHAGDIEALATWDPKAVPSREIAFMPARVLLQDFTGVPAVVDLAAMRDAMAAMGGEPRFCLLSLAMPPDVGSHWIDRFYRGFLRLAARENAPLMGGDLSRSETLTCDIVAGLAGWHLRLSYCNRPLPPCAFQ